MSTFLTCSEFNEQAQRVASHGSTSGLGWEVEQVSSSLKGTRVWMVGRGGVPCPSDNRAMGVVFYVWHSAEFGVPQIGLSQLSGDATVLRAAFPRLHFLNLLRTSDADELDGCASSPCESQKLLASHIFVETVSRSLWVIHPCDTATLLNCATADGISGEVLPVFLRTMAPFVSLPAELLPP